MAITDDWLPNKLEKEAEELFPNVFKVLSTADVNSLIGGAAAVVASIGAKSGKSIDECAEWAGAIWFAYLWRQHRVVYNISTELSQALLAQAQSTDYGEELPANLLLNLPYTAIAFRLSPFSISFMDNGTREAVAYNEFTGWGIATACRAPDFGHPFPSLEVMLEHKNGKYAVFSLPVLEGKTIAECVEAAKAEWNDTGIAFNEADARGATFPALVAAQVVLYLQAENSDRQKRPIGQRKKGTHKTATKPEKVFDVGYRIASALRGYAYDADTAHRGGAHTGGTRRPHTRRGHWHHYWTGPRDGERQLILKWVAPTVIHPDGIDNQTTVVPVK